MTASLAMSDSAAVMDDSAMAPLSIAGIQAEVPASPAAAIDAAAADGAAAANGALPEGATDPLGGSSDPLGGERV